MEAPRAAPVDVAPGHLAPIDLTTADVTPADATPADVTPADVTPADVTPADVTLADPTRVDVALVRLDAQLPVPRYARPGDAGADLCTALDVTLEPGERRTVPTGVAIALPPGYAGFVHPRSGLAARSGLTIVNAPGTVDSGYRGEIMVTLLNTDRERALRLARGDRIAQLVVQPVVQVRFVEVERLPASVRGAGGFGSTGGCAGADAPRRGEAQ